MGTVLIEDQQDDGSLLILQQDVEGTLDEDEFFLQGTGYRILEGDSDFYYLDTWRGVVEDETRVVGESLDGAGTVGHFLMERR
ncbi:MAG: hypothetical protein GQ559_12220 [Desulfobulbaceae bacterium]|nr:hypothetical protein [Desulfobulbaceae bacterium]